ncbi:hypothetical protein BT67DRAFT_462168 [Trichocladium antarcticum]|uniref:Uncharacterized protein n=1 Tax=Trichocladium antarcticum TaxID=1450529 RepID=A0AAN6UKP8_9PEZI|nr:hypothetical protein BT67DRAFT_462168 [Trichocladium antarcticum]
MFDWTTDDNDPAGLATTPAPAFPPCLNCAQTTHPTDACTSPCGHCGGPNAASSPRKMKFEPDYIPPAAGPGVPLNPHMAPACPVAAHNRCKCVPFPTFHTAARCPVPCRAGCGPCDPDPAAPPAARPGSFQHRSAMTCRARCCMCGLRGHSGRECRLRRCRCGRGADGGAHLGQDCGWKPTCAVRGCGRFWCGMHCRGCGAAERPFVGWRCWRCLGLEGPLGDGGEGGRRGRRGRGRAREREGDGDGDGKGEGGTGGSGEEVKQTTTATMPAAVAPAVVVPPEPQSEFQSIFGDPRPRGQTRANT